MKEQTKSVLLAFLVLLSMLMTYRLWFGPQRLEEVSTNVLEPVYFEKPRLLSEIVTPHWFYLYHDQGIYRFGAGTPAYDYLWAGVSTLLADLYFSDQSGSGPLAADGDPWLTVSFQPPLPAGHGTPWFKEARNTQLDEIVFQKNGDQFAVLVKVSNNGGELSIPFDQEQGLLLEQLTADLTLDQQMSYLELTPEYLHEFTGLEILPVERLFVPAEELILDDLFMTRENLARDLLLDTFFLDRSLVREIKERDGTLIFTDGEKGLRLSAGLNFSYPQLEQEPATAAYASALNTAGRLFSWHGGWPKGVRLEDLSLLRKANRQQAVYYAVWRYYYRGIPVLGSAAWMFFNDGGLANYEREFYDLLTEAGTPSLIDSYKEAILKAVSLLHAQENSPVEPLVLEEVELAYIVGGTPGQPRAYPVWIIRLGGVDFILKAKGLTVLKEDQP
ncbi:MAG: two-component system activity regulator YycH [Bacillota bacterium]